MDCRDWRIHQTRLQQARQREKIKRGAGRLVVRLVLAGLVLFLVYLGAVHLPDWVLPWKTSGQGEPQARSRPEIVVVDQPGQKPETAEPLTKQRLGEIIGPHLFTPEGLPTFRIEDEEGHVLFVRTTLEPDLQTWAVNFMPKTKALSAALVVLNPQGGQVLAMAGYSADGAPANVALSSSFPAASLIKIITAAAAVEKKKLNSASTLAYDGRKHTLYRKHLEGGIKEGEHQVTLKESFADSINTVFGKLGAFTLGPKALESFARRFYFNQPINFEMPVQPSQFVPPPEDDFFRLAEIASGFNRTTTVSPLHGAMLASAIVNNGRLMEPCLVREVFDQDNTIYYQHEPVCLGQVVNESTVKELRKMMAATVTEGTGRRRFRDADSHAVLSQLEIGGKSGSINNDQGNRVDWFVSYANKKNGPDRIALAVLVVHGEKLGLRSQEIAREAIIRYFRLRLKKAGG